MVAPALQHQAERHADHGVVLDQQDQGVAILDIVAVRRVGPGIIAAIASDAIDDRQNDGEAGASAGLRGYGDAAAEHCRQTLGVAQTHAEPLAPVARGVPDLVEVLEDAIDLVFGDADAGVPDLQPQLRAGSPQAEQHPPLLGVAECIGKQVAQYALQKEAIGAELAAGRDHGQTQTGGPGDRQELRLQPFQQGAQINRCQRW
jgi:hypothetical protein